MSFTPTVTGLVAGLAFAVVAILALAAALIAETTRAVRWRTRAIESARRLAVVRGQRDALCDGRTVYRAVEPADLIAWSGKDALS